ncbi:hypothetical protein CERSUDRAFT_88053 [Gelatoporia subvermispora B]|uniref:DUF6534 domain-containing protein n=1 Tax=Ceriporiopsis subvermispora (strain B) TaxID=914234 RepID=M2R0R4_CERS8|nr:hypothetical protein CERSUDRAFT_88053 [Gelatoporia subvermispora B]
MAVDLANTLGAILIGVIIVSVSYGAVLVQTYIYFQQDTADKRSLRSAIVLLWILATIHQLFLCHGLYLEVIVQQGNLLALETLPWSIISVVPITSAMNLVIRSVFCFRVWKFSGRNWPRIAATVLLSLIELGIAFAFLIADRVKLQFDTTATHTNPTDLIVGCTGWAFAVVADATITISQTLLLRRSRTDSPLTSGTNSALRALMLYSVSNGVLASMFALACFLTWITMSDNRVYLAFFCATPSLLLNALLATLNGRHHLRELIDARQGPALTGELLRDNGVQIGVDSCPSTEYASTGRDVKPLPPPPCEDIGTKWE